MLLLPTILNEKSSKILSKALTYLAISITVFNFNCSLFKTSNFQHKTDSSVKTIGYAAVGLVKPSPIVTV